KLASLLPTGHYTRKNLGYLLAFDRGATSIYETDDDNAPLPGWCWRSQKTSARNFGGSGWINVYRAFSQENIWPRGFPLDLTQRPFPQNSLAPAAEINCPIQQ